MLSESSIAKNIASVIERIQSAALKRAPELQNLQPRLVCVSKTKPVSAIVEAYATGQRHFGENYVQELEEKSGEPSLRELCPDIKWHFIGHLQRNKVNKVLRCPQLYVIETVDSVKLADALDSSWKKMAPESEPLRVMVQVNTSGESGKEGCDPQGAVELVQHVRSKCSALVCMGLMTIGSAATSSTSVPNPDFQALLQCRRNICSHLGLPPDSMELSMGMSADFEHAVEVGSTSIRIGSTIFGIRQ